MSDQALSFVFDARMDKLFKAMSQMEARVTAGVKKIDGEFRKSNKATVDGLTEQAKGFARLGSVTSTQRFVIQNTANQFGDMAVQIAGGTSAMRAMSQQLPQLLGGFGALGGNLGVLAPILGTVAAIGLPLAGVFFSMATESAGAAAEADTLAKKVDVLADAVSAYSEAAKLANEDTAALREKYGSMADEAQKALNIQEQLRAAASRAALDAAASAAAIQFGGIGGGQSARGNAQQQRIALNNIQEQLNATESQARAVYAALQALATADGPAQQVAAAAALRDLLVEITGSVDAARAATDGYVDTLNKAVLEGAELVREIEKAGERGSLIAGIMNGAAAATDIATASASNLGDQIWRAAQGALAYMTNMGPGGFLHDQGLTDDAGNPTGFAPSSRARRAPRAAPVSDDLRLPPIRSARGGSRNINKEEAADLAKAKSLYDQTRTATEKYKLQLDEINRLHQAGKIDAETHRRAIAGLNQEFASGELDQFQSGLLDLATGVMSVSDAFGALEQSIIRALAQYLLFGSGPFASGSFGGAITGILGGVFGGVPKYASGTTYHPGGMAIVGENGPELLNLPRGSQVIPNHDLGRGASTSGGVPELAVALRVDQDGNWTAAVERISSGTALRVSKAVVQQNNKVQYEARRRA